MMKRFLLIFIVLAAMTLCAPHTYAQQRTSVPTYSSLPIQVFDSNGNAVDDFGGAGGAGTQYTEGATDASITGTAMLWEDTSDTLTPISAAKPLPVQLSTQLDPTNDGVRVYGSDDGGTTKRIVKTDAGGAVQVDIEAALPAGTNAIGTVTTVGANSTAKINCTNNAFLNMTTATTTEIVALSGSTIIYVCSYSVHSDGATATNVKFVDGTGAACGTSQSDRSAAIRLTAATNTVGIARGSGEGMILKTSTAGDALCVTSSGAANVSIDISYAQF